VSIFAPFFIFLLRKFITQDRQHKIQNANKSDILQTIFCDHSHIQGSNTYRT